MMIPKNLSKFLAFNAFHLDIGFAG